MKEKIILYPNIYLISGLFYFNYCFLFPECLLNRVLIEASNVNIEINIEISVRN